MSFFDDLDHFFPINLFDTALKIDRFLGLIQDNCKGNPSSKYCKNKEIYNKITNIIKASSELVGYIKKVNPKREI